MQKICLDERKTAKNHTNINLKNVIKLSKVELLRAIYIHTATYIDVYIVTVSLDFCQQANTHTNLFPYNYIIFL